jgi:putative salt-induced outer membrane protein YdiY
MAEQYTERVVARRAQNDQRETHGAGDVGSRDVDGAGRAYQVRHDTDPPAPLEQTDTLTTVNLLYTF